MDSVRRRLRQVLGGGLACLVLLGGTGCALPDLRGPITTPEATVQGVERVEGAEQATTYRVHLLMENPNEDALPTTLARYSVAVEGESYETDTVPNATLPRERSLAVTLPAVVTNGGGPGSRYEVSGWVELHPPGQIKQFLYDIGVPRPRVPFSGEGEVE